MIHDVISYLLNQATWIVLPLITLELLTNYWVFLLLNFNKHVKSKEPIFIFFPVIDYDA